MLISLILLACSQQTEVLPAKEVSSVTLSAEELSGYKPLPDNFFLNGTRPSDSLIALGNSLFHEKNLSLGKDLSCSSCHDLTLAGVDGRRFSTGHGGALTGRNSPTVLNAAGHVSQFWDGRADSVETQALGPILASGEMAMPNADAVVSVLKSDSNYVLKFKEAFPGESDPITFQNVGVAIGAFERTLVTPSMWDLLLSGDQGALTDSEKNGFKTFSQSGCGACHGGQLLGGQIYMKLGLVNPWPNQEDQGRYNVTKSDSDKMMFKVPSLRNSTVTAPYFHDGSASDIRTAIKMMGHHQLGRELSDQDADSIATWLGSTAGVRGDIK